MLKQENQVMQIEDSIDHQNYINGSENKTKILDIIQKNQDNMDYENLMKGNLGLSKIFVEEMGSYIKITNIKNGDGYYFNSIFSLLWEEKDSSFFIKLVSTTLDTFISNKIKDLADKKDKSDEDINKISKLTKVLKTLYSGTASEKIFKFAKPDLVDDKFMSKLNKKKHLLPIIDGKVLDLKTLKTRYRSKEDYFDFQLYFDFEIKDTPRANKFFNQIMVGNRDMVEYLQTHLGYCMTGEINQRCIYIFWGHGSNAKSTLCDIIKLILGKLCVAVDKKVFIKDNNSSSHTEHLIPLVSSRVALYSETDEGDIINEGLIKSLTGGDIISARAIFGKQFEFKPDSKYIILTNNKPIIDVNSKAMLKRLIFFSFDAFFDDSLKEDNPQKGHYVKDIKFIEELSTTYLNEVFIWLCIGANKYYNLMENKKSIPIPIKIENDMNTYIKEMDSASTYIDEMCTKGNEFRINRSDLYESYSQWYKKENMGQLFKNTDFYKRLEKLGYKTAKSNGVNYIKGLMIGKRIKEEEVNDNEIDEAKDDQI